MKRTRQNNDAAVLLQKVFQVQERNPSFMFSGVIQVNNEDEPSSRGVKSADETVAGPKRFMVEEIKVFQWHRHTAVLFPSPLLPFS